MIYLMFDRRTRKRAAQNFRKGGDQSQVLLAHIDTGSNCLCNCCRLLIGLTFANSNPLPARQHSTLYIAELPSVRESKKKTII